MSCDNYPLELSRHRQKH